MKYIKKFDNLADARNQGKTGIKSPHLDFVKGYKVVNSYVASSSTFTCRFDDNGKMYFVKPSPAVYFELSAASYVALPLEGKYEYSYDAYDWSAATEMQEFTSSFYLRGVNNQVMHFTDISGDVKLSGNAMALINWKTLPNTVPDNAFNDTFSSFDAITSVSSDFLPATTLGATCYHSMFAYCTSLVKAPNLPATTLGWECYGLMFAGCTALTEAPNLPAATLTDYCYNQMFQGCTSLVNAPVICATTLAGNCCQGMFSECTSLVKAPVLLSKTLLEGSYGGMFRECSSLSSITCYATNITASVCTNNWVLRVSSKGIFNGIESAGWTLNSASGVPIGWTTSWQRAVKFNLTAGSNITIPSGIFEYSYNSIDWSAATAGQVISQTFYLRGKNNTVGQFLASGSFSLGGNAMALIDYETLPSTVSANAFKETFQDCTGLTSVPSDFLPATTLNYGCYQGMFSGCTSLANAPALPATTLAPNCYNGMFVYCKSLASAPELPATELQMYCYYSMFEGCTSLTVAPALPATTLAECCYQSMFAGCTALTTASEFSGTTLGVQCCQSMFARCKSLVKAPTLCAETLSLSCYYFMFSGCSSLSSITCYATSVTSALHTTGWTIDVAATGDFYGKTAAGWTTGTSGIPSGWSQHLT